ncbi:MAG: M67 family metallopeptidase [Salinisphaera sp.]|uniref:M67 family metallopeptidase n=1 Tax=Salinisphaera sp. TaxID=1914330 RepID=UPI003C7A55AE
MRIVDRLTLPGALGAALLAEARRAPSIEVCGLIADGGAPSPAHYPIANRASRAVDRFEMDPAGQIAAFKRMRRHGHTLIAIYHSHPGGEAEPSIHDRRGHTYPEAAAVIVAPNARVGRLIRAWKLAGDMPCEIPIEWTDPPPPGGFL